VAGFAIPAAHLVLPPEPDGTNLLANLSLPNASVLTMNLVSSLESSKTIVRRVTVF
jgi:hypothetical protein